MIDRKLHGMLIFYMIVTTLHLAIYLSGFFYLLSISNRGAIFYLFFVEILFLVCSIGLTATKKRLAKWFNIIAMSGIILLETIEYSIPNPANNYVPTNSIETYILGIFISVFWIIYFLLSQRVERTFVGPI
jgi:hypothetical protein